MHGWRRKLLRSLRKRVRGLFERAGYALRPRSIGLEITRTCNLRCRTCPRQQAMPSKTDLTADDVRRILGQFPRLELLNIVGFGEPLASAHLFEILDVTEARGIDVVLTTNGMLLDEGRIERLPPCVGHVYVSVDSPVPEKFEQLRPGAQFAVVHENIRALQRLRPDVRLAIQGVLTRETVEDATALVRFAAGVGARRVNFLHVDPLGEENGRQSVVGEPGAAALLQDARQAGSRLGVRVVAPDVGPRLRMCRAPWREPHIAANGAIRACCYMGRSPGAATECLFGEPLALPLEQYVVGSIFRDRFRDLWNGPALRQVRRSVQQAERQGGSSLDELRERRRQVDLSVRFSYCSVCLWRWGCAC